MKSLAPFILAMFLEMLSGLVFPGSPSLAQSIGQPSVQPPVSGETLDQASRVQLPSPNAADCDSMIGAVKASQARVDYDRRTIKANGGHAINRTEGRALPAVDLAYDLKTQRHSKDELAKCVALESASPKET